MVLGLFEDDYGSQYTITDTLWSQGTEARYRVIAWHPDAQYVVAVNDTANPGDGGRFTRIDWMPLGGMPPWGWAYCYSAYNAPTAAAAESTTVANRATPRTGCNGFPFSRMRPAP